MDDQPKKFHLFNCDNTYDLTTVEECLIEVDKKYGFQISVDKQYFRLQRMAELVETTLPTLEMDFAIFVVHADESRLSINEDNAGIGYAKLYRALLQKTNDKVLIVIGGDTYYKDDDEKDRSVISRWARRKVASQFNEEYLDGRKSFIFSWDKKHRPIHEEALRHYFDPSKNGLKYEPQPKEKVPTQSDGSSLNEEVTTTLTSQKNEEDDESRAQGSGIDQETKNEGTAYVSAPTQRAADGRRKCCSIM